MDALAHLPTAGAIGLLTGALLGVAAQIGRFCTLGAIEDAIYAADWRRARMWGVALPVAMIGVFFLEHRGVLDLSATVYARTAWNPLASIAGGLLFGYGMAIAGNCGFGALTRAAGGEWRSFLIVLVMGISAYMTLAGPLAPLRLALFPVEMLEPGERSVGFAHWLSGVVGAAPIAAAVMVAVGILAWAFASAEFRGSASHVLWGAAAGVAILAGWAGTALMGEQDFGATPLESHSFTAPLGESVLFLMTSSGAAVSFSVGSVFGVAAGALAGSLYLRRFRWEACDDPRELGRQVVGAFLMGVGGVVAVGCAVGQGLTAFSTLAWSAPLVAASIIVGAAVGLRQLIEGRILPAPPDLSGGRSKIR